MGEVRPRGEQSGLLWGRSPRELQAWQELRPKHPARREPESSCPVCSLFLSPFSSSQNILPRLGPQKTLRDKMGGGGNTKPFLPQIPGAAQEASRQGHLNAKATEGGRGV